MFDLSVSCTVDVRLRIAVGVYVVLFVILVLSLPYLCVRVVSIVLSGCFFFHVALLLCFLCFYFVLCIRSCCAPFV